VNLALFDFDGTISIGDTWTPFVRFAAGRARLAAGLAVLSPCLAGYGLGVFSQSTMRQIIARIAFGGRREETVRDLGARYARDVLPGVIRPQAAERIAWRQREGDFVVVVSASLDVHLAPWRQRQGLDLICSELPASNGRMTGAYRGPDGIRAEKSRRVRDRYDLGRYGVIYAYGDTDDDRDLLALAHGRFFRWRELDGRSGACGPSVNP
jgi:phosphatidylglycerophosphatase C